MIPATVTALKIGTRLDDQYEVLAPIGAGAMGEVYKAKDLRLDRIVALKVITATRDLDPQARDRFDREARALAALSHPHICNVYHYGEDEGTPYLVMEYLKGQTVAQRLRSDGKLPPADVLRFGAQIAEALHVAHQAGIVHRDLKPENVMLTEAGPKLLDLGVSKRLPEVEDRYHNGTTQLALSAVGTISGTVPYMAPEQLEGHPADVRSDIFSFGAVLYEMATGRRAFEGQSQARIIASIMSQDPVKASSLEPALPVSLDAVLERCLKKTAEARYQTSLEVAAAIRDIREGAVNGVAPVVSAGGSAGASDSPAPAPSKRRRRRLIIRFSIGISFGVLALALVVNGLTRGNQPARQIAGDPAAAGSAGVPAAAAALPAPTQQLTLVKPVGGTIVGAGGILCGTLGSNCTVTLPTGAPVALNIESDRGHQFVAFTGDCVNGATTMAGPRQCGATFVPVNASVAATAPPTRPLPPPGRSQASPSVPPPPAPAVVAGPPAPPPAPQGTLPVNAKADTRPATAELRARGEIASLVQQYCSAYESLEVDRVRKLFPRVYLSVLRSQLEQYKSLQCTLTDPLAFMVLDAGPNGRASVTYRMRHVIQMKAGGPPRIVDLTGMMMVSRSEPAGSWTIDAVTEERKEEP